jgi:hypothetical protein
MGRPTHRRGAVPLVILAMLLAQATALHAQPDGARPVPVVRASARVADVRDGRILQRGYWSILPELRPDVYVVKQVGRGKRVTFYTDLDSISFHVTRGSVHDFVIALASGDSAFTRITTVDPGLLAYTRAVAGRTADTVPFTLGRGNKMHVRARVNASDTLDLMFDTGANRIVLSRSGLQKGAGLTFQGTQDNAAFGGSVTVRESRGNTLEMAGLRWRDVPILVIDRADADGIIGYNVFENRIVEIDYDRSILVIRDSLPRLDGYAEADLHLDGNLMFIPATLGSDAGTHTGRFELDTGASWGLFVGSAFVAANRLSGSMPELGERSARGLGPHSVKTRLVRLPMLELAGYPLHDVPIDLERPSGEQPRGDGILVMDVLRRFNTVLDLREYRIYLKPNGLVGEPYNDSVSPGALILVLAAVTAVGIALLGWRMARRRRTGAGGPDPGRGS